MKAHFLRPLLRANGRCGLKIERTGAWLVQHLELAGDSASRTRGLLGRDGLEHGCGLVIAPTQGIHTFGMRFPLDIVAVTRSGCVVKWRTSVPPRRIVLAWNAFAIIEVSAGSTVRSGLALGDRLVVAVSHF